MESMVAVLSGQLMPVSGTNTDGWKYSTPIVPDHSARGAPGPSAVARPDGAGARPSAGALPGAPVPPVKDGTGVFLTWRNVV